METILSQGSDSWPPWRPSPPLSSSLPNAYESLIHHNNFESVQHGFDMPSSERAHQAFPELLHGERSSSVILPPLHTIHREAPFCVGFQKNTEAMSCVAAPERMSIDIPGPPGNPSQMTGTRPTPQSVRNEIKGYTCQCRIINNPMVSSPMLLGSAEAVYSMPRSYSRVPVDGLLDSSHSYPSLPSSQNQSNIPAQHTKMPAMNPIADTNIHMHYSDSIRSQSPSAISTAAPSPLRAEPRPEAQYSAVEQRYFLLNTLYDICVDATASHILCLLPHHHSRARRRHPYHTQGEKPRNTASSFLYINGHNNGYNRRRGNRGRSATLMDNISKICTNLWRKARHDAMAPHRAEADAVREMRDLYGWGELVARAMDSDGLLDLGLDMDLEEGEIDDGGESVSTFYGVDHRGEVRRGRGEMNTPMRVGRAAKKICEWVKDAEAWDSCQSVVDELRDVGRVARGYQNGDGGRVEDVGDGEGSIA